MTFFAAIVAAATLTLHPSHARTPAAVRHAQPVLRAPWWLPRRSQRWWLRRALCFHHHEGSWHDRRNPSYRGGMQFGYGTWATTIRMHIQLRRLRLPYDPADASIYEQLLVTWYRYHDESSPWSDWVPFDHAYYCLNVQ